MDNTINGKTPEEIKKGLEHCAAEDSSCKDCVFCADCDVDIYAIERYALAYIQQLERERDALLKDFKNYQNRQFDAYKGPYACDLCKWGNSYGYGGNCKCPDSATCIRMEKWEWRGVQEVE